jgi:hypothetical protein
MCNLAIERGAREAAIFFSVIPSTLEIGSSTMPFYLPLGSVIAPHGYLVLFPSMFSGTFITTNVRLLIGGVTIDQVNIPSLPVDQSYARIPDGSNVWRITNTPTVDSSNNMSQLRVLAEIT